MSESSNARFTLIPGRLTFCLLLALLPQIALAGNWGQGKWGTMLWGTGSETPSCNTYGTSGAYVQKVFVAYLGRPAAPGGLKYYAEYLDADNEGGKLILFDDLYYSPEAEALYNNMTLTQRINQFYQNMFNRDALSGGLNYWIGEINAEAVTIPASAAQIADAASGEGMAKLDAKQVAASKLTCAIGDDAAKLSAFQANAAGARASIAAVTTAEQAAAYNGETELAGIIGSARPEPSNRSRYGAAASASDPRPIGTLPTWGVIFMGVLTVFLGLIRLQKRSLDAEC